MLIAGLAGKNKLSRRCSEERSFKTEKGEKMKILSKFHSIWSLIKNCPEYVNVLKVLFFGGSCKASVFDRFGNFLTFEVNKNNVKDFIWLTKLSRSEHLSFRNGKISIRIDLDPDIGICSLVDKLDYVLRLNGKVEDLDSEHYLCFLDDLVWFCRKESPWDLVLGALLPYHHEPVEYTWFISILKNGDIFVDVGANVGGYAVRASKIGAEVYAIEPERNTFFILKKNAEINNSKVNLFNVAVGANRTIANLYGETGGGFSLLRGRSLIGHVKVLMLDDIVDSSIKLLKIDVEGFEFDALKGAEEVLAKTENIIIEMTKGTEEKCHSFLKQKGFSLVNVCMHAEWPNKPFNCLYKVK